MARLGLSLYADDAVVFLNPIKATMDMLMAISKSSVAPIQCSQVNLDDILQNFNGLRATFPTTYLGLCDRTTSEMRGSSLKIISGDSRQSENAQTHI
jgi:hypothetical protein